MAAPDPFLNNRFRVEIDGVTLAGFAEVVLPEAHVDVIDYREGNEPCPRKFAGLLQYGPLVLRRGVTVSDELFQWWKTVANGQPARRNVVVALRDAQGQDLKRWAIGAAWPARYTVCPLIALDGDAVLIETVECAVESFEVIA